MTFLMFLPGENVKLFADDTNLFISGIDICALNNKCNYCIERIFTEYGRNVPLVEV